MNIRILHFYPDLMSLYGSYANVSVLRRTLEQMGNTVTVEPVALGQDADIAHADFIYMGAGTERSQKAALADFIRFGNAVTSAAENGMPMLFAGNSMELLGKTITDDSGKDYAGIGLANFTSVQGKRRIVGDVCGSTDLYPETVVGFMNKCSIITGVETPLLSSMKMGFGNEKALSSEGFRAKNVIASQLTGPILAKNPRLLDKMVEAIYAYRNEALPAIPQDLYAEQGWAITSQQLLALCEK